MENANFPSHFSEGVFLLFLALALCGCSRGAPFGGGAESLSGGRQAASQAAYDDTGWAGAAYNPEGPAGLEGQTPPAFRDMGSLYGETGTAQTAEAPETTALNPPLNQGAPAAEKERKLIKNARIQTMVDNLEEAAAHIEALLEQYQGYASNSSVRDTSRSYTIKIPSAQYETALREVGNIGKILYRSETVEDATIKFYDLEGRLNTRMELLKTFQAYLGKAKDIEEIMTVEKRIAELQQEIDWYGSQLADLSHLSDYATINLELLGPVSESVYYKPSLKDQIAGLFESFSTVASTVFLVLLGILVYGIPALFILILLFWILFGRIGLIRKVWRLAGAKKDEK
jgi:hypothetical protein